MEKRMRNFAPKYQHKTNTQMKKTLFLLLLTFVTLPLWAGNNEKPFVVPEIKTWQGGNGQFVPQAGMRITYTDATLQPAAEQLSMALRLATGVNVTAVQAGKGDITMALTKPSKKMGQEAYTIDIKPKHISITATTGQGAMWAVQTLTQIADQQQKLPCGKIMDEPDYRLRGFMMDCGRKYIPMDYLRSLVKVMSYYKMNSLGIHLNDNGFKKYFHNNWDETYAAFRMESELFPELTARDGHYTKAEFREFVKESAKLGVDIVPEIDVPAHSLAFTHFRPELGCEEFGVDHLDLTNPTVVPFLDSLFLEYIGGPDPVFAGPRVHIGTDEYSNKKQEVVELFRGLTDHLITLVKENGKQPVAWGSLTYAKGETPVQSDGVLLDIWNNGFADPKAMHEAGFQMVSIPDGWVYIVPAAGYYYDYLYDRMLYEKWTPANIGGVQFQERDPQIEGGMFAVWNDVVGNGISLGDVHHRTFPAMQVMAHKCWHAVNDTIGYPQWDAQRKLLADGPGVDELGRMQCELPLLQPSAPICTEVDEAQIGYDYQIDMDITWAQEEVGTILTESNRARFYLSDPISGMLGFSRDGYLFTFKYSGRPGLTEHLTIQGTNKETRLLVNGKLQETLGYDQKIAADLKPYNVVRTLVFPLSRTGAFKSHVTNFSAKKL